MTDPTNLYVSPRHPTTVLGGHMSSKQEPAVVTDENVEQQFLWLTNTAGNQLAELVGGVSSTAVLDQRAVDQLRSIAEVAGKLADRYEKDAVPAPPLSETNFGLVVNQPEEEKTPEERKAAEETRKYQEKLSAEGQKNAPPEATVPEPQESRSDVKPRQDTKG